MSLAAPRVATSQARVDTSLGTELNPRSNAINSIRLVLAVLVIAGHADALAGYTTDHSLSLIGRGLAVDCFFILSGFLMAQSWTRRPDWSRYLWHRAVRLFPAYWFALIVTAFVIVPSLWLVTKGSLYGFWGQPDGPVRYVLRNALMWTHQGAISGSPADVAVSGVWNGAVWTLGWVFLCDIGLVVLGLVGILGARRAPLVLVWLGVWLVNVVAATAPQLLGPIERFSLAAPLRFSLVFLTGVIVCQFRDRVPLRWPLAAAAAVIVVTTQVTMDGNYRLVAIVPLAYALLWLSARLPVRVGSRNDLSYGIFLFGFPIQQSLVILGVSAAGWAVFVGASVIVAVPFAAVTWLQVEKRAMRLREARLPRLPAWTRSPQHARWVGVTITAALFLGYLGCSYLPGLVILG